MKYSWQVSIDSHLNDFSFMSENEFALFLEQSRYGIAVKEIFSIVSRNSNEESEKQIVYLLLKSIIGKDESIFVETSIEKLTGDEYCQIVKKASALKKECKQAIFRRVSWESC